VLEEVAADEAEVTDVVETVEIEVTDEVEVIEEVLRIVADVADVVDLVEADIDRAIEVVDGTYIGLIRGLCRICSVILNQISVAFVLRRVIQRMIIAIIRTRIINILRRLI
jgi:hypothetical protein